MMRSLWTAASGMTSQQTNLDTIANNLSNINTTGYKAETNEFKTLLYSTLKEESTDSDGNTTAKSIQVGSGVRNSAITTNYTQGTLNQTDNPFDLAIQGNGFFMVRDVAGEAAYTRNGSFKISMGAEGIVLADSVGNVVLSSDYEPIVFPDNINTANIVIDTSGRVLNQRHDVQVYDQNGELAWTEDEEGNVINDAGEIVTAAANNPRLSTEAGAYSLRDVTSYDLITTIGIAQFNNPSGLTKAGGTLLYASESSGEAKIEGQDTSVTRSSIKQGYLEASTVSAIDEMVNMIVAQRAYEMNSKIITASDEMLQQANNLRR